MRVLQLESRRTALEAAQLLTVFNTGWVNVVDDGICLGTVSERDLIQPVTLSQLL
ncbi:hypothetical protein JST97_36775 [bacterium]|nr:hypothetical protein [bacterium]